MNARCAYALVFLMLCACQGRAPVTPDAAPTPDGGDGVSAEEDANAQIAAAVPVTDIWIMPLDEVLAANPRTPARNVTARRGYDNQPAFSADGRSLYYASIRDGRQSDVYVYDIESGATRQVTNTPESEYSPTPRGAGFSTVQVALDGTQRLWWYDDGGEPVRPLRADVTGVGYHAWLGEGRLALFLVEDPLRLVIAELEATPVRDVATGIGRSLHRLADGRLGYVRKHGDDDWAVHEFDPGSGEDRRRAATLPEAEDMAWLPDGSALMASGRGLHILRPGADAFALLVELPWTLHGDIGRLAVDPSGRWLAVVVSQLER